MKILRIYAYCIWFVGVAVLPSVHLLVINDPEYFQKFGSFIIFLSILNIANYRNKLIKYKEGWNNNRVISNINSIYKLLEINDRRSNVTQDLNTAIFSDIHRKLNIRDPWGLTELRRRDLVRSVRRQMRDSSIHEERHEALEKARRAVQDFNSYSEKFDLWLSALWYLELYLLMHGTLQWGYGDSFVKFIHSNEFSKTVISQYIEPLYPFLP